MYAFVRFVFLAPTLRQMNEIWRKLVGVEPTCDTKVPHDGFEARAQHRPRVASKGDSNRSLQPLADERYTGGVVLPLIKFSPVV
jgi:hypothetical protein